MRALAIHGGAGVVLARISPERRREYEASLSRILDAGFDLLERGGSSLDAVMVTVRMLEDDPLFNAGLGAALTSEGPTLPRWGSRWGLCTGRLRAF